MFFSSPEKAAVFIRGGAPPRSPTPRRRGRRRRQGRTGAAQLVGGGRMGAARPIGGERMRAARLTKGGRMGRRGSPDWRKKRKGAGREEEEEG